MADKVRLIKKYPNRRLYDTANSGYITLADVKQMVLEHDRVPGRRREVQRRPDAGDPAADHPRRGVGRRADVLARDADADDPLLRQRAADDHGPVHRAERQGVPGDPEEAAGPGEADLRRQDDADADLWKQFMQMQAPAMQGMLRQLPRAERDAVHGHAAADAGPDARHVRRLPVPGVGVPGAARTLRRPTTTRRAGKSCTPALRPPVRRRTAVRRRRSRPRRRPDATDAPSGPAPRVGFVSLGCPKALVDSEQILTQLRAEGYAIVADYDGADLVVVNTCGFIDAAVAESLDAIGEALAENGKVIVTGCLGAKEGGASSATRTRRCSRSPGPHATARGDGARCTRTCRSRTIRSSISCRRRGSSSRRRTTRTSRSAKAATTAARSASSRRCAATS